MRIAVVVLLVCFGDLARVRQSAQMAEQVPKGWVLRGSNPKAYAAGLTELEVQAGARSAFLTSRTVETVGFGALMQVADGIPLGGQALRMSGYAKAEEVALRAGLWLRIDDAEGRMLVLDNMEQRPITGTMDWTRYETVLHIPAKGVRVAFGALLVGSGTVYIDNFSLEVLDADSTLDVEATELLSAALTNLDFEE